MKDYEDTEFIQIIHADQSLKPKVVLINDDGTLERETVFLFALVKHFLIRDGLRTNLPEDEYTTIEPICFFENCCNYSENMSNFMLISETDNFLGLEFHDFKGEYKKAIEKYLEKIARRK